LPIGQANRHRFSRDSFIPKSTGTRAQGIIPFRPSERPMPLLKAHSSCDDAGAARRKCAIS
jgi:hypothetical protein